MKKVLSLPQQIYDYVANEIRFGNLAFGHKINENELIDVLATSRTPIREALIQLAADGFLDNIPRKGFFVRTITEKTMQEVNTIVACLDVFAAKHAVGRLQAGDYVKMEQAIADMDFAIESKDYLTYCLRADDFHRYYYEASGNLSLPSIIDSVRNQCLRHTFFGEDQEKLFELLAVTNQEHRQILALVQNGNIAELEPLLIFHWTKEAPGMWAKERAGESV